MGTFLDLLSPRLKREEPVRLASGQSASVAVIFRETLGEEEVLLITRAKREGDPWSGHVAFPGGMVDTADRSFEETARRETWEEVRVDISENGAVFIGYMEKINAHLRDVTVVPCVFKLTARSMVSLSLEVASYEWVTMESLARKEARSTYVILKDKKEIHFPSLLHGELMIWGITERIISEIIGEN